MAEREEREIKNRDKLQKDVTYRDRQNEKEVEIVDRATLKKQALEERRRREEDFRARQADELEHEIPSKEKFPLVRTKLQLAKRTLPLDPSRQPPGSVAVCFPMYSEYMIDGANGTNGSHVQRTKADVPPPSEMPISSEWMDHSQAACIQTFGAPELANQLVAKAWSSTTVAVAPGRNVTGKMAPPLAQGLLSNPVIGIQAKPDIARQEIMNGSASMPVRSKIQDASDVATGAADFILGEDDVRRTNNMQNVEESYTAVPESANVMGTGAAFQHLPSSEWNPWQKYDQTFSPFTTAGVNLNLGYLPLQIPSDQSLWAPKQDPTDSSKANSLFKGTPWTPIWQTDSSVDPAAIRLPESQGRGSTENASGSDYSVSGQGMSNLKNTREVKALRKFSQPAGGPVKKDLGTFPPQVTNIANSTDSPRISFSSQGPRPSGRGVASMSYGRVKKIMPRPQGDDSSRESASGSNVEGIGMDGGNIARGGSRGKLHVPQSVREAAQALSKQRGVLDQ